jgi:hypothetical protein
MGGAKKWDYKKNVFENEAGGGGQQRTLQKPKKPKKPKTMRWPKQRRPKSAGFNVKRARIPSPEP